MIPKHLVQVLFLTKQVVFLETIYQFEVLLNLFTKMDFFCQVTFFFLPCYMDGIDRKKKKKAKASNFYISPPT